MNEKATQDALLKCNDFFNGNTPEDYIFFLKNYNGGILFKIEDFAGYNFFNIDKLIKENKFQENNFQGDWDEKIILFCECIGDGEYLGFKLNTKSNYEVIYCIMDTLPQEWISIESSFEDLINKLIFEKGKKYWLGR